MVKPTRKPKLRRLPADASASDREHPAPDTAKPLDPTNVAAALMLNEALRRQLLPMRGETLEGKVTIVQTPTAAWTSSIREVWRSRFSGKLESSEDPFDGIHGRWLLLSQAEHGTSLAKADKSETLREALWQLRSVAAFSPAPDSLLPADIASAADFRLNVEPVTAAVVSRTARLVTGQKPTQRLKTAEALEVTPNQMRLARRRGQTADDYVERLRKLVSDARSTELAASPRKTPTLDRLHGMEKAVAWGRSLAKSIGAARGGLLPWSELDRGCLLVGPPGCGKTLFARGLAATCGVPLIAASYGGWLGTGAGHQGTLLKAMQSSFQQAREQAPSILFIDELDSFPDRAVEDQHRQWDVQVVNALLALLDGIVSRDGVVVIGACNHPDLLDPALVRSGRLDRRIAIRKPDSWAIARIFREHLGADLPGEDLHVVSLCAAGATGADCERFVRDARQRARLENRPFVLADLMVEVRGISSLGASERWIAAVHEAGHALVASRLMPRRLKAVTIREDPDSGGVTAMDNPPVFLTEDDLRSELAVLLAGRAAEEVSDHRVTSAAGGDTESDLFKATRLAVYAASCLGLCGRVGLSWRGHPRGDTVGDLLRAEPVLAGEVERMLNEAYQTALLELRPRRRCLHVLVDLLLEHGALDATSVDGVVQEYPPAVEAAEMVLPS